MSRFEEFLLEKLEGLPPFHFPPSLLRAIEKIDDPRATFEVVSEELQEDFEFAGKIVQEVAVQETAVAADVHQAIRLIGLEKLKSVISTVSAAANPGLKASDLDIMQGRLLRHSQLVAQCAMLIAAELGFPNFTPAYIVGLLHDFGTAVLNAFAPDEIDDVLHLTQAKLVSLVSAEDRALGLNHAYLGSKVLTRWGIPEGLIEAVRHHHQPSAATSHFWLVKLIHLADVAMDCNETKLPIGISLFPVDKKVLAEFGIAKERLAQLAKQASDLHGA